MSLCLVFIFLFLLIRKKQDATLCILPRFYFPSNSPSISLVGFALKKHFILLTIV